MSANSQQVNKNVISFSSLNPNIADRYWTENRHGKVTFDHVLLAQNIVDNIPMIWVSNVEDLYHYEDGVYKPGAEHKIGRIVQEVLGRDYNRNRKLEVIDWIKTFKIQKKVQVDQNPNIVNLKNGLYDIKNNVLKPHSYDHYSTIQLPVNYNPKADCPNVKKFLTSVLPHDSIKFALEWFGYCMYSKYSFQKILFLLGTGGNGKSKFIGLLNKFIGKENISSVDIKMLSQNQFAPALLVGKLVNAFADVDDTFVENSGILKVLSGGEDGFMAEHKHKTGFLHVNTAKLMFSANRLPSFKDTTDGLLRRIVILPFPNKFKDGENADRNILEKMTSEEELSGLLNLAITGLNRLFKNGAFTISETMKQEIDTWMDNTDNVKMFINDNCNVSEELKIEKRLLFKEYQYWCNDGGYKSLKMNKFYERMENHGFSSAQESVTKENKKRTRIFKGIGLAVKYTHSGSDSSQ